MAASTVFVNVSTILAQSKTVQYAHPNCLNTPRRSSPENSIAFANIPSLIAFFGSVRGVGVLLVISRPVPRQCA